MNSKPTAFFAELKRRNVLRAAAFYAASAWLIVQVATQVFPFFDISSWVVRWIVVAAAIGFPFAMLFAWFYEWTPRGIQRDGEVALDESIARQTGKKIDRWIIAVLAFAVVLLLANIFVLHKDANTTNASLRAASNSSPASDKSIAVLPLANESGDKDQQYFSDGLSEDLITALSQFTGLKVISRNSSFQFRNTTENSKTIGDKLGVVHLLEGSVRRAGDMVRISAELVNAADGSTLWSQRYDRPYKDLFALQDDITSAVAAALKAKLLAQAGAVAQSERPPSGNLAAWNAYSHGKFPGGLGTPADYRKAIDFYTQATQLDPRYARAYAALADTWTILAGTFLSGDEQRHAYSEARTAADRALQLDADVAAAHDARGLLLEWVDFDFNGAQAEFQRALELAPNDSMARFRGGALLGTLGNAREAVPLIRQSIAIDPRNGGTRYWLGWNLAALGRLDDAEQAMRAAVALSPHSTFLAAGLVIMQIRRGETAVALATAQQQPPGLWRDFSLALALQGGADRAAADAALQTLIAGNADGMAYQIAEVHALRKDPDNAFTWLDRAWASRDPGIGRLLSDPFILPYRNDPRFAAFCRKVGLPDPEEAAASDEAASSSAPVPHNGP